DWSIARECEHRQAKSRREVVAGLANPSPKRKRVGVCAIVQHSHKYPRACAWGSEESGLGLVVLRRRHGEILKPHAERIGPAGIHRAEAHRPSAAVEEERVQA